MTKKFSEYFYRKEYDKKSRFINYWNQINEVYRINPEKILEVGIGGGFVYSYLKSCGFSVVSADIDTNLNPDVVADITNLPFKDKSFDLINCCQVLEHMPYEKAVDALKEIDRVSSKYAIISLPDVKKYLRFMIDSKKFKAINVLIEYPSLYSLKNSNPAEHYWEVSLKDYELKKIINDIEKNNFFIKKTFRMFEDPYYRFFILEKKTKG